MVYSGRYFSEVIKLKNVALLSAVLFVGLIAGCATMDDLRQIQNRFDQKVNALQEENAKANAEESAKLQKLIDANKENLKPLQKNQADVGADLIDIRDQVQKLKGSVEELERHQASSDKDQKERDATLKEILLRLKNLEDIVTDIGKTEENPKEGQEEPPVAGNGKLDSEEAYESAYKEFTQGQYDEARRDFQKFLQLYPKSDSSDKAQFWLGECYYSEGNYEKAILEYEKVIKDFSQSDKVPPAMLKQAFSFLKLKDKSSAKLLLKQVIRDYPNTNQAKIAKKKLAEIK